MYILKINVSPYAIAIIQTKLCKLLEFARQNVMSFGAKNLNNVCQTVSVLSAQTCLGM